MPEQQTNKERLKDITDSIESGIKNLFQSDKYAQYLQTMSRFHRYSVNNTMLIYMQKPDATLVAGFNKWKDQFSRNVMKGEKGIKIIAPTPFKKKIEQEKLDPDTKLPMLDADGKFITEEKTVQIPMYKVVSVFDVSQTDGKPLPTIATDLSGNVQNYDVFMEALKRSAPVPIGFEAMPADTDGYFAAQDQRIAIREGMSEVQTVSATVHEIAHSKLHNRVLPEVKEQWKLVMVSDGGTKKDFSTGFDSRDEAEKAAEENGWRYVDENEFEWNLGIEEDTFTADFVKKNRNTEEVEAESISFAVCAYYGIPTGENSFGYIATWSKDKELPELRESLETINKTSSGLITDIDRNYAAIMKERGLDKAEPEAAVPTVEYLLHSNPRSTGEQDRCFVQAYTQQDGELIPGEVIGVGTAEKCREIADALSAGGMTVDDAKKAFEAQPTPQPGYEEWSEPATAENAPVQPDTPSDDVAEYLSDELPLGGGKIVGVTIERYDPDVPQPPIPDGYPMPDPALSISAMNAYGYTDGDMLPLTNERAMELFERDITVYMLYEGNGAGMAFDAEDIELHTGIFGVTREEWEQVKDSIPAKAAEEPQKLVETRFMENPADSYCIYQLKNGPETSDLRFMGSEYLDKKGLQPERENYYAIYTGELHGNGGTQAKLNGLYETFNIDHPEDFRGHSLSVSDIVALKQSGVISCHYVDSIGFKELPTFMKQENYLKNAEMAVEDDYNQIDGIVNNGPKQPTVAELEQQAKSGTPISLMDLMEASRREREQERAVQRKDIPKKKPSVLAQLRAPLQTPSKNAPHKSMEKEL